MTDTRLHINGHIYWYHSTYTEHKKALARAKQLKKDWGGKTFIRITENWYGAYPIYHVYTTKVRKIWS